VACLALPRVGEGAKERGTAKAKNRMSIHENKPMKSKKGK
jgi:hypothetical protein